MVTFKLYYSFIKKLQQFSQTNIFDASLNLPEICMRLCLNTSFDLKQICRLDATLQTHVINSVTSIENEQYIHK